MTEIRRGSPEEDAEEHDSNVRIGSDTAYMVAGQAVSLIGGMLVGILVSRAAGTVGKGTLSVVQQVVGVLLAVSSLGISSASTYFISTRKVDASTALGNALVAAALVTLAGAVPLWLVLSGPASILDPLPVAIFAAALASFALGSLLVGLRGVSAGVRGLKPQALASIASASFSLIVTVVLFASGRLDVLGVLVAAVVASAIAASILFAMSGLGIAAARPSRSAFRAMFHYSARSYAVELATYLHLRLDILVLGWLAGAASVGVYSVGVSFAELARYVPLALGNAIFVKASRVSHESAAEFTALSMRILVVVIAVTVCALALLVPLVVTPLFGIGFAGSADVFYLLAVGVAASSLAEVAFAFLYARGRVYWRESVLAVVVNVVLGIALIQGYGYRGAAVASSVSYTLFAVIVLVRFAQTTGARPAEFLVPRRGDIGLVGRVLLGYSAAFKARLRRPR